MERKVLSANQQLSHNFPTMTKAINFFIIKGYADMEQIVMLQKILQLWDNF